MAEINNKSVVQKKTAREKAEMIIKMTGQAERVGRKLGAEACVVICVFKDGNELVIQDAGKFAVPPDQLYEAMMMAHANGQLGLKPKSRILRPN